MAIGREHILASQAYVYPDLQQNEILYTYDFGENWEHVITLKRALTFDERQGVQVPSCAWSRGANRAEDGQDAEDALEFNRQSLNQELALWSRAGEQMIRADDLGLIPKFY